MKKNILFSLVLIIAIDIVFPTLAMPTPTEYSVLIVLLISDLLSNLIVSSTGLKKYLLDDSHSFNTYLYHLMLVGFVTFSVILCAGCFVFILTNKGFVYLQVEFFITAITAILLLFKVVTSSLKDNLNKDVEGIYNRYNYIYYLINIFYYSLKIKK
ncbi:hypothetical protein FLM55_02485 [Francisella sp. Scap27]|uniref:hypothetical protein n=1 Tax=Francisella sp. Scap27 TaxID=2589986 RepID=UPI0015BAE9E1|nr:hypothetical protein [Francisella sp. Scap27]QLE78670.1 hypothetical protein FLM55_02485 [Francisella sp. Scap27]